MTKCEDELKRAANKLGILMMLKGYTERCEPRESTCPFSSLKSSLMEMEKAQKRREPFLMSGMDFVPFHSDDDDVEKAGVDNRAKMLEMTSWAGCTKTIPIFGHPRAVVGMPVICQKPL